MRTQAQIEAKIEELERLMCDHGLAITLSMSGGIPQASRIMHEDQLLSMRKKIDTLKWVLES